MITPPIPSPASPQPDMLAKQQDRRASQAAEATKRAQEMAARQAMTQQRDVANRARIAQDAARLRSQTGPNIDQLMSQMGPGQNPADMAATKAAIAAKNTANQAMAPAVSKPYAKGGKISLEHCSVSTTSKGKRNSNW